MAPHSSTLAWKIPWTEEPGGLQSMGSRRVRHDWVTSLSRFYFHALEKEMATHSSVLAWRISGTGEPGGLPSMVSHRVGHDWSDLAAAAAGKSLPLTLRHSTLCVSAMNTLFYSIFILFDSPSPTYLILNWGKSWQLWLQTKKMVLLSSHTQRVLLLWAWFLNEIWVGRDRGWVTNWQFARRVFCRQKVIASGDAVWTMFCFVLT